MEVGFGVLPNIVNKEWSYKVADCNLNYIIIINHNGKMKVLPKVQTRFLKI